MSALSIRVDPETAAFLECAARQTGRTKSELVRQALEALRNQEAQPVMRPAAAMTGLIGCWDSGGMRLSERTGARFAQMLQKQRHEHRTGRRRPARRAD